MVTTMLDKLDERPRFLVEQAMDLMDALYDGEIGLLRDEERPDRHDTRSSVHYALGLLVRGEDGDAALAEKLLHNVIDLQLDAPGEIYDGTFLTAPEAARPPGGYEQWNRFGPGFAYFLNDTLEKIASSLEKSMAESLPGLAPGEMRDRFWKAADSVIPPVWRSFDPNWREFIACSFAVILEHFETELSSGLIARMDVSMRRAVAGSIHRRLNDAIPMNSNIELMHIFAVHYFGYRYSNNDWIQHAEREASGFLVEFREFGSFAEFNTTTYYGVDLTVLGMWRRYGRSPGILAAGLEIEAGLWRNIGLFYNPVLENLSGPFARAYEMEMTGHSSVGVFLYLALGDDWRHLTGVNCETSHDPLIALVGVNVPEDVLPGLMVHGGDRYAVKRFRELCERDRPGQNRNLCTAAAWIERNLMIGAMSGSRNTNGQMHPATIHWISPEGERYYLRLIRREKGKGWNTHFRGIVFDAKAEKDKLEVIARIDSELDIEVYFEITGPGMSRAELTPELWRLPGLLCRVKAKALIPVIQTESGKAEIVYAYQAASGSVEMSFVLELEPEKLLKR
ncbi:hypothetical protein A7K91_09590 [Paenibacillus oryzae]|uniref:Heparinase n=1 Tax=Paenibacillus oryzae TaxID=1844972 RepID=A0A1A5YC34_9BACL|nr:hypothetical protein [Paenibacillus oryzae]OBR62960.1 hypothetical protein A7K91_09590 [Paenibacillus oryzae]